MLHALAITYSQLNAPKNVHQSGDFEIMEKAMSANVQNDLNWLESELAEGIGSSSWEMRLTAADVMMVFSIDFILARQLGTKGCDDNWPGMREWLQLCKETETYRRAVEKTGYKLSHRLAGDQNWSLGIFLAPPHQSCRCSVRG